MVHPCTFELPVPFFYPRPKIVNHFGLSTETVQCIFNVLLKPSWSRDCFVTSRQIRMTSRHSFVNPCCRWI